jgi:hypothetical protein
VRRREDLDVLLATLSTHWLRETLSASVSGTRLGHEAAHGGVGSQVCPTIRSAILI